MEQTVNKITELITILNEYKIDTFNADTLSGIAIKLASLKAGLGEYVDQYYRAMKVAENRLSVAKSGAYGKLREEGQSQGDAKELRNSEIRAEMEALSEAEAMYEKLKTLSYNVHDIIDSIKSRIIHQQMDRRDSDV